MKKRFLLILLSLVIAAPVAAQERHHVTFMQATAGFLQLPVYVAAAKHYFEDEGIDAELVVAKGGSAALAAVLGGSGQICVGVPSTTFHAREKGQDLVIFASLMDQYASNVIISAAAAKKAGLTRNSTVAARLAAMKGLRLGITGPGSATDQLTRFLARKAGLNPDRDITIVPLGSGGAVLAAFSRQRIDGFAFSSPTSDTAVVKDKAFTLFDLSNGGYEPLAGFLYVTMSAKSEWLKKNPVVATKIVRAMDRALKLLKVHPEEGRKAMRSFFPKVDEAVFNAAFNANLAAYPATARIDGKGVKRVFDFMEATEGTRPKLKVDDVYTNDYVSAAEKNPAH